MARYKTHQLDIYGAHLHVATDPAQWAALRRKVNSLQENPGGLGYTSRDIFEADSGMSVPHFSVFIDVAAHEDNLCGLIETCAHEAAHVAGMLLDHIEQTYDGTSEHHAYLVGWTTRWLWESVSDTAQAVQITLEH